MKITLQSTGGHLQTCSTIWNRLKNKYLDYDQNRRLQITTKISKVIIKITISSIVIGLKNSYFPLIHLPSCYGTVQQANHIQSCSLNQPITFKVVI